MSTALQPAGAHSAAGLSAHGPSVAGITIEIGGFPVCLLMNDPGFREKLAERYSSFVRDDGASLARAAAPPAMEFELRLDATAAARARELQVSCDDGRWMVTRGEFRAEFDVRTRRGQISFAPNPYSVDAVLRVLHSLLLARAGGLLLHASSGIRRGNGVVFSGVSGAGKTTMARLAPPDVCLLTDEISYIRRDGCGFRVYGTPFSGELGIQGENVSAPLRAVYLIEHAPQHLNTNRIERMAEGEAVRRLMRNVLFFTHEKCLVAEVFGTVCELARLVPVFRLEFMPDMRVWDVVEKSVACAGSQP